MVKPAKQDSLTGSSAYVLFGRRDRSLTIVYALSRLKAHVGSTILGQACDNKALGLTSNTASTQYDKTWEQSHPCCYRRHR